MKACLAFVVLCTLCAATGVRATQVDPLQILRKNSKYQRELLDDANRMTEEQRHVPVKVEGLEEEPRTVEERLKLVLKFPQEVSHAVDRANEMADAWRNLHSAIKEGRSDIEYSWSEFTKYAQKGYVKIVKVRNYAQSILQTAHAIAGILEEPVEKYMKLAQSLHAIAKAAWDEARWYAPVYERLHAQGGLDEKLAVEPILQCSGCEKAYNRGHLVRRIRPEGQRETMRALAALQDETLALPYPIKWSGMEEVPREESWAQWANRVDFPRPRHCDASCVWEDYSPRDSPNEEL